MSWIVNFYGTVGDDMSFGVSSTNLQTRPFDSLPPPQSSFFLSCTRVGDAVYLQYNIVTLRPVGVSAGLLHVQHAIVKRPAKVLYFCRVVPPYRSALSLLHNILTCVSLTNYVKQSRFSEANSSLASQEIPHI